jgi:hypothetical protein
VNSALENKGLVSLIWQTSLGNYTDFEHQYITEVLFSDFEQKRYYDNRMFKTIVDNAIIIYSNNYTGPSAELLQYLNKYINRGFQFYLLHLSNENLNHNTDYYKLAKHVFRNYYDKNIDPKNVSFLPLGFKSGFLNKEGNSLTNDRKYQASFIGQPKSDRLKLIDVLRQLDSSFIHTTTTWDCPTALTQEECIKIYKQTRYIPCPKGYVNPDSFRICEALEWGCIPIIMRYDSRDYFQHIFPNHPFPTVGEWSEIHRVISENNYLDLAMRCSNYYRDYKRMMRSNIGRIIS